MAQLSQCKQRTCCSIICVGFFLTFMVKDCEMKSVQVLKCNNNNNNYNSHNCNNNATSLQVACVAGAWKQWLKERTGARSFSRARFFLCPPGGCPLLRYAGYVTSRAMNDMKAERDLLNSICDRAGFFFVFREEREVTQIPGRGYDPHFRKVQGSKCSV